jgi:hypothetical protein
VRGRRLTKRGAQCASHCFSWWYVVLLEITLTSFVTAIAVQFDGFTRAFA